MNENEVQDTAENTAANLDSEQPTSGAQDATQDRDYEAEIKKLREENAVRRLKAKELEKQLLELKPLADKAKEQEEAQKSAEQKLLEQLEALKKEKAQAEQQALVATQTAALTKLATMAGIDVEVIKFLDLGKFDFENEKSILETLELLKPKALPQPPKGGAVVNPQSNGNVVTEADLMEQYFRPGGRNAGKAFGDFGG